MTGTKNENHSLTSIGWLVAALLLLTGSRLYGLSGAALPDYDSVRNWQIVQEVAAGNLRNLFHHGSPLFSLLYAPVAWLTSDFHVFQHLNALVAVAAVARLTLFVGRAAKLSAAEPALLLLFTGTSVFLTFSGRDFTMSAWSLLAFGELLRTYYRRLQLPSRPALLRAAVWLTLGLSINYKFLLTLPILLLFELLQADGLLWRRGTWWRVLLVLATPYVVLSAVGTAVRLPWYRWLGVYYNILVPGAANAAGRQANIQLDVLYYLKYLRDFESPLVGLAVPAALWLWRREIFGQAAGVNLVRYLTIWAYSFLAGMSLLLKAPRGLLLAYGLFYVLAFLSVRRLLAGHRWALALVLVVATAANLYRIQREVYHYSPSSYGQVAAWLRAHGSPPVVSTVGLGLAPFIGSETLAVVQDEQVLPARRRQGCRYVLLDDYWRVTNVLRFGTLQHVPAVAVWPEPMLTAPLLFLEHSEYTGLSYEATLALQKQARRCSTQLRLIRIPN